MRKHILNQYVKRVTNFHNIDAKNYMDNRYGNKNITQVNYNVRRNITLKMMDAVHGKILDIGCGPGSIIELINCEDREIYEMDISIKMIKEAKKLDHHCKTFFLVNNALEMGLKGNLFDGAIVVGVIGYIPEPIIVFKELNRIMKRGATAIIQTSNRISIKERLYEEFIPNLKKRLRIKMSHGLGIDFPLFSYSKRKFDLMLKECGFYITDWQYYDFHIPFLERFSMKKTIEFSKYLQRFSKSKNAKYLGSGYIVKAVKI